MADLLFQPCLIDGAQLFQQDDRILHHIVLAAVQLYMVGSFALCIFDVMAAQMTVGLCMLPHCSE